MKGSVKILLKTGEGTTNKCHMVISLRREFDLWGLEVGCYVIRVENDTNGLVDVHKIFKISNR